MTGTYYGSSESLSGGGVFLLNCNNIDFLTITENTIISVGVSRKGSNSLTSNGKSYQLGGFILIQSNGFIGNSTTNANYELEFS